MSSPPSEAPRVPDAVTGFLSSMRDGSHEALLAHISPEFVLRSWDGHVLFDREGFERVLGWDEVAKSSTSYEVREVQGDTVVVEIRERNEFTRLLDLAPFRMEVRLVVRDGLIAEQWLREIRGGADGADTRSFQAAMAPILAWAEDEAPALFAKGTEDGTVTYDAESARALLELVRTYGPRGEPEG